MQVLLEHPNSLANPSFLASVLAAAVHSADPKTFDLIFSDARIIAEQRESFNFFREVVVAAFHVGNDHALRAFLSDVSSAPGALRRCVLEVALANLNNAFSQWRLSAVPVDQSALRREIDAVQCIVTAAPSTWAGHVLRHSIVMENNAMVHWILRQPCATAACADQEVLKAAALRNRVDLVDLILADPRTCPRYTPSALEASLEASIECGSLTDAARRLIADDRVVPLASAVIVNTNVTACLYSSRRLFCRSAHTNKLFARTGTPVDDGSPVAAAAVRVAAARHAARRASVGAEGKKNEADARVRIERFLIAAAADNLS